MPTLVATPLLANSNSYVSRADADTYLTDSRLYVTEWTGATADDTDRALIWATALLDIWMDWDGNKRTTAQRLRWPRTGLVDRDNDFIDDDTIPEFLEEATADFAVELLKSNRQNEPELMGLGFSEAAVGSLKVKVDKNQVKPIIPDHILARLDFVGRVKRGPGAATKLERA